MNDPYSGLHMSAGRHHVDGIRALQFARDRHSFALSDLARISDQQQLLSSVLSEAVSSGTLTNPVKFSRFLAAATSATRVDQQFNVVGLADQLRYIRPGAVSFTTVPLASTNYLAPNGESAVLWNAHGGQRPVRADQGRPAGHAPQARGPPVRGAGRTAKCLAGQAEDGSAGRLPLRPALPPEIRPRRPAGRSRTVPARSRARRPSPLG